MIEDSDPPEHRSPESTLSRFRSALQPRNAWFALILFGLALIAGLAASALWLRTHPTQSTTTASNAIATPDPTHPPLPVPMASGLSTLPPPATPAADAPRIEPASAASVPDTTDIASSSTAAIPEATASTPAEATAALDDSDPQVIDRSQPEYPSDALQAHMEGEVRLMVSLDALGAVEEIRIVTSSGSHSLDRAATDAVRSWHYRPARHAGAAVSGKIEVPVEFQLDNR